MNPEDIASLDELIEWITTKITSPRNPPIKGEELGIILRKLIEFRNVPVFISKTEENIDSGGNIPVPSMTNKNWLVGARVNNEPIKDAVYDPLIGAVTGFGGYLGGLGLTIELTFI